ncbi:hypothetical protein PHYSODRAFT_294421 [Phytophthora sojae]|uniref:Uncharacterized protein n=1 Tax=Phytophthora sojae (strain P6497) TaxID=1094619 RepID=G4YHM1_PHYSP|nr:hypothetical protein PHYSODRAFT_294421 [Phytophthora sojae]EGZ29126.1 hypothetical protein PHYSODRAFT_294421 [Phytophthora sojae]|eukprot:XP_009516401.1 hypothetical protein PHYSODRAFT_294421 [Phytophthora sojae]
MYCSVPAKEIMSCTSKYYQQSTGGVLTVTQTTYTDQLHPARKCTHVYIPLSISDRQVTQSKISSKQQTTKMSTNSTSTAGDSRTVTKTTSSNAGDSCTWYAGESCSQPRTGYDCLNVLLSTDECAIDPNGACVSVSVYKESEPPSGYFPASNYSYCSANDSVCSTCLSEWTTDYETTGSTGTKTYCTGSDGCVCVAAVEVPNWEQTVIANKCDGSSTSADNFQDFSPGTQIGIILALCIGGVVLLSVFVVRRHSRRAPVDHGPWYFPESESAHHAPSKPQLSLAGWKSLREKLIEAEHELVEGDTVRLDVPTRSPELLVEGPTATL